MRTERDGETERAAWDTIWTSYEPVARYLRDISARAQDGATPPICPQPLDFHLVQQLAAFAPAAPVVLDLAAEATWGASTVAWATHDAIARVVAPHLAWAEAAPVAWRSLLAANGNALSLDATIDDTRGWDALTRGADDAPVFCILAVAEDDAARLATLLQALFAHLPRAVAFVLSLGQIGRSAVLDAALAFCADTPGYRLTALREISPFLAASELGVIARQDDADTGAALDRLAQVYTGNFQFLTLARATVEGTQREQQLRADVAMRHQEARAQEARTREIDEQLRAVQEARTREIEARTREIDEQLRAVEDAIVEKNAYIAALETRAAYLEATYLPWKDEYIVELETRLRNLSRSKALRAERLARRLLRR